MTHVVNVAGCEGSTWLFWTGNSICGQCLCRKPTTSCFCYVTDADCYWLILSLTSALQPFSGSRNITLPQIA